VSPLMTVSEVAKAFRASEKQPNRWAKAGLITRLYTPGGSPRFLRAEIEALLAQGNTSSLFLKDGAA
jgi:predicted site-specific integrase-resolvase